jgi:hypothetical protein
MCARGVLPYQIEFLAKKRNWGLYFNRKMENLWRLNTGCFFKPPSGLNNLPTVGYVAQIGVKQPEDD